MAERELARLRDLGLGNETDGVFADGVRNWVVPMESGQYLEVLAPDRSDDAGPEDGTRAAWRRGRLKRARHDVTPLEISHLDLVGDPDALNAWLGGALPVSVTPGAPARLAAVHIRTDRGDVVIQEQ